MLKQGDTIIYGNSGICRIVDIKEEDFLGEKKNYYVLKPLYESRTTIHVPEFNERLVSKIKPVFSKNELLSLLGRLHEIEPIWIDNDKQRQEKYKELLDSGERDSVVGIIKALLSRNLELTKCGKKLNYTDEQFLSTAKHIFEGECAYVLEIDKNEVENYIFTNEKA